MIQQLIFKVIPDSMRENIWGLQQQALTVACRSQCPNNSIKALQEEE